VLVALAPVMVAAAPPVSAADAEVITACLDAERQGGRDGRACIGRVSDPCLEGSGSDTTQSMVECLDEEAAR
jgi:hypothetical protein